LSEEVTEPEIKVTPQTPKTLKYHYTVFVMMYLNKLEEKMFVGEYGAAVQLAMKSIVKVGDKVKAERLIPVASGHLGTFTLPFLGAYASTIKRLVMMEAKVNVFTSVNPNPFDTITATDFLQNLGTLGGFKQPKIFTDCIETLGVSPTWTCTPYEYGNIPRFGQHVSWDESSADIYVNAVLGARTNRESGFMDLLTAIAGRTPYHGLHLDENRRGEILCTIKKDRLTDSDYPAIGCYIAKHVETHIPVIVGMPNDVSADDLKNFGAGADAVGAVSHFHVPRVTPEAPTVQDAFNGEPPHDKIEVDLKTIVETKDELSSLSGGDSVDILAVGCPHASYKEVVKLAEILRGKKIRKDTQFLIYTHNGAKMLAKHGGYADVIEASGAKLVSGCPLLLSKLPPYDKMHFMTNSGKMGYYLNCAYGSLEDCVKSGVTGKVVIAK
jgi:predicted aconitase